MIFEQSKMETRQFDQYRSNFQRPFPWEKVRLFFCSSFTTHKSAIAASRRNCGRRYPILLCHLLTQNWQNQKFRCSPETFRLSFYGIQGVPKKIWAFDITVLQGSKGQVHPVSHRGYGYDLFSTDLSVKIFLSKSVSIFLSKFFKALESRYAWQTHDAWS